jgi:hypothetical protein
LTTGHLTLLWLTTRHPGCPAWHTTLLLHGLSGSLLISSHPVDLRVRFADRLRAACLHGLRPVDINLDVALHVLHAHDLVIDRAERGEDELEVFEKHGPPGLPILAPIAAPRTTRYLGW